MKHTRSLLFFRCFSSFLFGIFELFYSFLLLLLLLQLVPFISFFPLYSHWWVNCTHTPGNSTCYSISICLLLILHNQKPTFPSDSDYYVFCIRLNGGKYLFLLFVLCFSSVFFLVWWFHRWKTISRFSCVCCRRKENLVISFYSFSIRVW